MRSATPPKASRADPLATNVASVDTQSTKHFARSKYVYLDLARGVAALFVLAGHLRAFVFSDLSTVGHVSILWQAFYLSTSLGQQAVMVFFVLSGFLISKNISQTAATGRWSWAEYAIKRISRLWIVLLPALVLTIAWDRLAIALTNSSLYRGDMNSFYHSTPMGPLNYTIATALGNISFLQTILVPTFGSNGPLWSLANEFWYYVLFPFAYFSLRPGLPTIVRLILAVAVAGLCFWLPKPLVILGLVWLMGYGVYLALPFARRLPSRLNGLLLSVGLLLLLAFILLTKSNRLHDTASDYSIGLAFAVVLIALTQFRAPYWVEKFATYISEFSYTLYLVHFPFLAFVFSFVFRNARFAPSIRGAVIFAVSFLSAAIYAFGVYYLFERNTPVVQKALSRRLGSRTVAKMD